MVTFVLNIDYFFISMKKTLFPLVLLFLGLALKVDAQDTLQVVDSEICDCPSLSKKGKGTFYFMWGYNRDWYSKSDIHFKNTTGEYNPVTNQYDSYDFTLQGVRAKDRGDLDKILKTDLTIPQYNYRLGYFFNDKHDLGVEINFDHTKYVVIDNQTLHLKGTIRGVYYDQDTLVSGDDFLALEHTDGANFLMVNFVKRQNFVKAKNKMHWLSGIIKVGAGIVIPRTDVTLFGERKDNRFHVAGYIFGLEAGLRYDAFKHFFLEYTAKGAWANYANVLSIGNGKINHSFYTFENILLLGVQFPL